VLIGRLGHDLVLGWLRNRLSVQNNWLRDVELDGVVAKVLPEILQADFEVQLTNSGDYVLVGVFVHDAEHARVRFLQTLHAFL